MSERSAWARTLLTIAVMLAIGAAGVLLIQSQCAGDDATQQQMDDSPGGTQQIQQNSPNSLQINELTINMMGSEEGEKALRLVAEQAKVHERYPYGWALFTTDSNQHLSSWNPRPDVVQMGTSVFSPPEVVKAPGFSRDMVALPVPTFAMGTGLFDRTKVVVPIAPDLMCSGPAIEDVALYVELLELGREFQTKWLVGFAPNRGNGCWNVKDGSKVGT